MNEYENNPEFREYVDKYAKARGISVAEALTHKIVEVFYEYKRASA